LKPLTPFTDPTEVLSSIKGLTDRIHVGLYRLLPITRGYFESLALPVEKTLHAMLTRHRLRHQLSDQQIDARNEETSDERIFDVRGVPNCGLVISGSNYVLRILKWRNGELPPASTKGRYDFYQGNLFAFETNDPFPESPVPPLNLVAAWETNEEHELRSFSVVCPWGEIDNRVQSKWWRTLDLPIQPATVLPHEILSPEPDLDEITPKNQRGGLEPSTEGTSGTTHAETDDAS
jgi:hypothetical protein